jgi:flagellar assembly factor FliW
MSAAAARLNQYSNKMIVKSDLLGSLEVEEIDVFHFPLGLFGFPDTHDFVLLPVESSGLYWLQSTEHSALAFLLVDPFLHFNSYSVDIGAADLKELNAVESSTVAILAIVTLPSSRSEKPTANLQGPVAFNFQARRARQLAIQHSEFDVRCAFDLEPVES